MGFAFSSKAKFAFDIVSYLFLGKAIRSAAYVYDSHFLPCFSFLLYNNKLFNNFERNTKNPENLSCEEDKKLTKSITEIIEK